MFMFRHLLPLLCFEEDKSGGGGGPKPDPEPDPKPDPPETKPPWGDDKDFDAGKAWKLLQNVREDARKAKADRDAAQATIQEHEDAKKTESERAAEKTTEAEKRATTAEGNALRLEVALEKAPEGMTLAQVRKLAKRLTGTTKEELEADADELFEDFTPEGDGQAPRSRPKERLRPGAAPSSEPEETDPIKLAAQVPRMY